VNTFSTSYALVKASWQVLRQDKEILWFPVLSAIAALLLGIGFALPMFLTSGRGSNSGPGPEALLVAFLYYLCTAFAATFFNVALISCAAIRMDGGDPTLRDGLRGAAKHWAPILAWAVVSATVGLILKSLERRSSMVVEIVSGLIGAAWGLLTFFVVPVLIFEGKGVPSAIARSGDLFKNTSGQQVVGEAGMGVFFFLLALIGLVPVAGGLALGAKSEAFGLGIMVLILLGVAYWVALALVASALGAIFNLALYRFAVSGAVPEGFNQELVANRFRAR